jgi:hypothetical protein
MKLNFFRHTKLHQREQIISNWEIWGSHICISDLQDSWYIADVSKHSSSHTFRGTHHCPLKRLILLTRRHQKVRIFNWYVTIKIWILISYSENINVEVVKALKVCTKDESSLLSVKDPVNERLWTPTANQNPTSIWLLTCDPIKAGKYPPFQHSIPNNNSLLWVARRSLQYITWLCTHRSASHSFSSLSYDRSKASSKASYPHSAIQSFLLQMKVSSHFLNPYPANVENTVSS